MGNYITKNNLARFWEDCLSTFRMNGGQLLWQNANPTASFASQTLNNLPDMSNYDYIIIAWSPASGGNAIQYLKIKYSFVDGAYAKTAIPLGFIDDNGSVCHRKIRISTDTSIIIENGMVGASTINDARCVPMAIYGTNDLGYIGDSLTTYKHNLFITIIGTGQQAQWKGRLALLIENNNNTLITTWQQIYDYMVSKNIAKLRATGQIYSSRPINLAWIGYEFSGTDLIIDFYGVNMTTYNNDSTGQYEYSLSTDTVIEDVIL